MTATYKHCWSVIALDAIDDTSQDPVCMTRKCRQGIGLGRVSDSATCLKVQGDAGQVPAIKYGLTR